MHTYNDILRNTLEQMAADAEDKGNETFGITLDLNDAKILIDGLTRLAPTAMEDHNKIAPIYSPLADTVEGMLHPDYKERFKAEYQQTKIRYNKLHKMLVKADAHTLDFEPTCSLDLLCEQKAHMGKYLYCLEVRAEIEGISLD